MQYVEHNMVNLLIISLALGVGGVVLGVAALVYIRNLRYPFKSMAEIHSKKGGENALMELLKGVDENREFIRKNKETIGAIIDQMKQNYSAMGLVKYNAFEDIGGNQSYSFCLLNEKKDGVIFTNLVGRNSTRGYALEIKDGRPSRELSDEEKQAFQEALARLGD